MGRDGTPDGPAAEPGVSSRELEAFVYGAIHDLRAPLRAIRGFSRILADGFADALPAPAREHVLRIQSAAVRMDELMNSLQDLSRSTRSCLRPVPVDLSGIARNVMHELAEQHPERNVEWSIENGLTGYGDPALLRLLLQKLLDNAWKFTRQTDRPAVRFGALQQAGETLYLVSDNGCGFDSTAAAKLFQPFERMHPAAEFPGAGIGLAVARRVVQRHGGVIRAESTVGAGAPFLFSLGTAPAGQNRSETGRLGHG